MQCKERLILEENIKLHESEAYFYVVQHPEIYNFFEQKRLKNEIARIRQNLPLHTICLDIGSGTGNICSHVQSAGHEVIACDLSQDMLKYNKADHRVLCEVGRRPFRNQSFELTTSYSVLHHLPDLDKALEEICRVSADSSILYFDHDPFLGETTQISKFGNPVQLVTYLVWLLTKPHQIKKLIEYILWGRRKHLKYVKANVNFKLTEGTQLDLTKIHEILRSHRFKIEQVAYKNRCFLKACR